MGKEAVADYQQWGKLEEKLDEASSSLRKSRRRMNRRSPDLTGSQDMTGHPAEPLPPTDEPSPQDVSEVTEAAEAEVPTETPEVHPDGVVTIEATKDEASDSKSSSVAAKIDLPTLEALIFTTRHPLTTQRIGELMDVPSAKVLRQAIAALNEEYESSGRSFRIEQVAGGYQMLTLPHYGALLNKLHQREIDSKLSRSALETLSIIAYKQPVLRAEVEAIRGVASGETIRSLMEKHLVKIAGRAEEPGRPILYGTTKRFLEVFGLNTLKELPKEDQARPSRPKVLELEVPPPAAEAPATPEQPAEAV